MATQYATVLRRKLFAMDKLLSLAKSATTFMCWRGGWTRETLEQKSKDDVIRMVACMLVLHYRKDGVKSNGSQIWNGVFSEKDLEQGFVSAGEIWVMQIKCHQTKLHVCAFASYPMS